MSLYFIIEPAFYLQLGSGLQNERKVSTVGNPYTFENLFRNTHFDNITLICS